MSSLASLDSSSSDSSSSDDHDEEYRLAQQEWEESLEQLQTIVSLVVLPFFGKWLGRKWSHWAYTRYLSVGLGKTFFFGNSVHAQ
ncbi:hypothetical protein K439DRAFT_1632519, partial [Ramaria rubella]